MGVTLAEHFERSNSTVLAVGQFETAEHTDGIVAAMAALDVAFIGPVDLFTNLSTPGKPMRPRRRPSRRPPLPLPEPGDRR